MDPFTAGVMIVLGKYAADKVAEIVPVIGAEAIKSIERLFKFVVDRLAAKGSKESVIVQGFKDDPETFEKPFAKLLDEELKKDRSFAQNVKEMVDSYNNIIDAKGVGETFKINVKGDMKSVGSVFGSGSVRADGDIVGGDKNK